MGFKHSEIFDLTHRQIELYYKQSIKDKNHEHARLMQAVNMGMSGGKPLDNLLRKLTSD